MKLSSDYPLDQIIYTYQSSYTLPAFGIQDFYIDHGLPFRPLMLAEWTTDPTWELKYEFTSGVVTPAGFNVATAISAGSTQVYITLRNNTSSPVTVYYRAYGLMPPFDLDKNAPFTNNLADQYMISTDFVYPKVYQNAQYTLPSSGGSQVNYTLAHNQDARIQFMAWEEISFPTGHIRPVNGSFPEDSFTPFPLSETVSYDVRQNDIAAVSRLTSSRVIQTRMYVDEQ